MRTGFARRSQTRERRSDYQHLGRSSQGTMRNNKVFSKSLATILLVAGFGLSGSSQAASVSAGSDLGLGSASSGLPMGVAETYIAEQAVLNSPTVVTNPVSIENHSFAKGLGLFLALAMVLAGVNMRRRGVRETPLRQSSAAPRYRSGGRSFDPRRAA